MWGQEEAAELANVAIGIIPTRVGTSMQSLSHNQHIGSSPRVWGQDMALRSLPLRSRIIPTRVGTRSAEPQPQPTHRDHPHACGDKLPFRLFSRLTAGSSPRVWGQVKNSFAIELLSRIIPTRVGTRRSGRACKCRNRDHPHACGDKRSPIKSG